MMLVAFHRFSIHTLAHLGRSPPPRSLKLWLPCYWTWPKLIVGATFWGNPHCPWASLLPRILRSVETDLVLAGPPLKKDGRWCNSASFGREIFTAGCFIVDIKFMQQQCSEEYACICSNVTPSCFKPPCVLSKSSSQILPPQVSLTSPCTLLPCDHANADTKYGAFKQHQASCALMLFTNEGCCHAGVEKLTSGCKFSSSHMPCIRQPSSCVIGY